MHHPALIFDFGNVIAFFDFARATARLGATRGLSGRDLLDELDRAGWAEIHREYEHGRLSSAAFGAAWLERARVEATHDEFEAAWSDIFTPNESIAPVLESLHRQGYPLILGSNTNALHAAHFREAYRPILDRFDALVLSFEIGQMKPSLAFYLACAEAAGRPPSDCVFVDDLPANVAGARAAGMRGLLYSTTDQLVADLDDLGIVAPARKAGDPRTSAKMDGDMGP